MEVKSVAQDKNVCQGSKNAELKPLHCCLWVGFFVCFLVGCWFFWFFLFVWIFLYWPALSSFCLLNGGRNLSYVISLLLFFILVNVFLLGLYLWLSALLTVVQFIMVLRSLFPYKNLFRILQKVPQSLIVKLGTLGRSVRNCLEYYVTYFRGLILLFFLSFSFLPYFV